MRALGQIRGEIDSIDDALVALLVRRFKAVDEIAELKRAGGLPVADASREAEVLARVGSAAGVGYSESVCGLFSALFDVSKARQRKGVE